MIFKNLCCALKFHYCIEEVIYLRSKSSSVFSALLKICWVVFVRKIFVTGSAGFIGFHLSKLLLENNLSVLGYDGFTDYYDVSLKHARNAELQKSANFYPVVGMLEDFESLFMAMDEFKPDIVVHLAAQAGVRHSILKPRTYLEANILGTFNVLEASRNVGVGHLLIASTSSVYGSNTELPFLEIEKADFQMSFYAATKKSCEAMGHSFSHIYQLPITMFRFFTVYGPWGRPDMALFKFTKAIINDEPIDVYNHGEMWRDFTYVEDLVKAISLLFEKIPDQKSHSYKNDSISPVAPYRIVNIGNSEKVKLIKFIEAIESSLSKKARLNFMDIQQGDVPATWSDTTLLKDLTGYKPETDVSLGVDNFVRWYKRYYRENHKDS